jgi:serine protease
VALTAPGNDLLTTLNAGLTVPAGHSYGLLTGTSFSAPLVAGTAALMLSVQPDLTPADLTRLLKQSVRPHTSQANLPLCRPTDEYQRVCNCTTDTCGSGLLDAHRALVAAAAAVPTPPAPSPVDGGGGGGATGALWGAALWLWVAAVALFSQRRRASRAQQDCPDVH